jgi:hypothetical protein
MVLPPDAPPGPPVDAPPTNAAPADVPIAGATRRDTGIDTPFGEPFGATSDRDAAPAASVTVVGRSPADRGGRERNSSGGNPNGVRITRYEQAAG